MFLIWQFQDHVSQLLIWFPYHDNYLKLIFSDVVVLRGENPMTKSVSDKMGIKEYARAIFISAPPDAIKSIDPPSLDVASSLRGNFDYIHFFAAKQTTLQHKFPSLKEHLNENGMLWVSWPKARQKDT